MWFGTATGSARKSSSSAPLLSTAVCWWWWCCCLLLLPSTAQQEHAQLQQSRGHGNPDSCRDCFKRILLPGTPPPGEFIRHSYSRSTNCLLLLPSRGERCFQRGKNERLFFRRREVSESSTSVPACQNCSPFSLLSSFYSAVRCLTCTYGHHIVVCYISS